MSSGGVPQGVYRLDPLFDNCVREETTADGRLVYSTDRMEHVLCLCGWEPETARLYVARLSVVTSVPGWPDFLDYELVVWGLGALHVHVAYPMADTPLGTNSPSNEASDRCLFPTSEFLLGHTGNKPPLK